MLEKVSSKAGIQTIKLIEEISPFIDDENRADL